MHPVFAAFIVYAVDDSPELYRSSSPVPQIMTFVPQLSSIHNQSLLQHSTNEIDDKIICKEVLPGNSRAELS